MKSLFKVFANDKCKDLTYRNRNYFFLATIAIVLLNIILYAVYGSSFGSYIERPNWNTFSATNLYRAFLNSFEHSNWQHVSLNMVCFFIAGIYLERKKGTLEFLLFIFLLSAFTAFAISTNYISLLWHGFSGVNYGLYGYIIMEFGFTLLKKRADILLICYRE